MDRRVTSPTFLFYILLNGDVYDMKFFLQRISTHLGDYLKEIQLTALVHKHAIFEVQKPTDDCVFCCRQSS